MERRREARTNERARKTRLWRKELHPKLKNQLLMPENMLDESLLQPSLVSVEFFAM